MNERWFDNVVYITEGFKKDGSLNMGCNIPVYKHWILKNNTLEGKIENLFWILSVIVNDICRRLAFEHHVYVKEWTSWPKQDSSATLS